MAVPREDDLEQLRAVLEDKETWRKVLAFTRKHLSGCGLPADDTAIQEAVNEAVLRAIDGRRPWNPSGGRALSTHLIWIVRDFVSKRLERGYEIGGPRGDRRHEAELAREDSGSASASPFGVERAVFAKRTFEAVNTLVSASGDEEVEFLVMAIEDGAETREELSATTGLTPAGVTNARKRLARILRALPADLHAGVKELR